VLGRREVLKRFAAAFSGGFALPALAGAHPMRAHLADSARVAAADVAAGSAPVFLTAEQLGTLTALAEAIVPGSTLAAVAPFIDRLLAVDTAEHQQQFVAALDGLSADATARYARAWPELSETQRVALLTAASTQAGPPEGQPGNLRSHFEALKGWVVGGYYSSEIGMRELGFTGNMFYAAFPGCTHPEGHG
jgi:Gluconate 2-dehydrogenase subunit 3